MGQLVVRVACGAHHCAALTAQGALFTWGGNGSGQLGHGDTAPLSRRRRVAALAREQVERVACGRSHMLARTAGGDLYGWGSHEFGQLGVGGGEGWGKYSHTAVCLYVLMFSYNLMNKLMLKSDSKIVVEVF